MPPWAYVSSPLSGGLSKELYHGVTGTLSKMVGVEGLAHTKTTNKGTVIICYFSMPTAVLDTKEPKLNKDIIRHGPCITADYEVQPKSVACKSKFSAIHSP